MIFKVLFLFSFLMVSELFAADFVRVGDGKIEFSTGSCGSNPVWTTTEKAQIDAINATTNTTCSFVAHSWTLQEIEIMLDLNKNRDFKTRTEALDEISRVKTEKVTQVELGKDDNPRLNATPKAKGVILYHEDLKNVCVSTGTTKSSWAKITDISQPCE